MLQEKLREIKRMVDCYLKDFFAEKKKGIGAVHPEVKKMIEDIGDVTLRGGDRFRPFMVYLGAILTNTNQPASPAKRGEYYQILSNTNKIKNKNIRKNPLEIRGNQSANKIEETKNKQALIKLMCATELLHSFALIHDDIIDKAEMRRNGPTIKPNEKAILAGDLCFTFADELLNGMSVSVKEIYDKLREEVIAGEWLDVKFARESWENFNMKHPINLIHEYKTARYSFEKPLKLGIIFAGGALNRNLQQFAIQAGIAFQYADDYLDLFGDERLGKKIGGDIKEGNITIFHESLVGLKNKFNFKKYCQIWHNSHLTEQDILWVQDLVEKTGIKRRVEEKMKKLIKEAKDNLEKVKINHEIKSIMIEFADFLIEREY